MTGAPMRRLLRPWPLLVLAAIGALTAYYLLFTGFQPYDDEGYLLVSLQSFVDGKTLYSDVYTQYGPFYYELFGLLFAVTGRPVTTDAGRFIVLFEWVAIASLLGASLWRLTGSRLLGLATLAVSLRMLPLLVAEPMHPVGLVLLLLAVLIACVAFGSSRRTPLDAIAIGCLCAALLLTKVNIGGIACLALLSALVLAHADQPQVRRWRWVAVGVLALVPLALLSGDLDLAWVRRMLILEWGGLACVAMVVLRGDASGTQPEEGMDPLRWLAAFVVAAAVTSLAIVAIILALGSSLGDVIDGVLIAPTRLRDIFMLPFPLPEAVTDWAIAAVAIVVAWTFAPGLRRGHVVSAAARIAAGLVIWASITASSPVTFSPGSGRVALPALLVWLVAVAPADAPRSRRERFVRLTFVLLPLLGVLQGYPVAGTQVWASALLFVPAGALLLWDGGRELAATLGVRSPAHARWIALVGTVGLVAVVAKFAIPQLDSLQSARTNYRDSPSLAVNGADRVHVDPARAEAMQTLVTAIRNECSTFVSRAGFNNLYIWTNMKPPTGLNAGDWMFLLDSAQQQRVVDAIRGVDRLCLVQNDQTVDNWLGASGHASVPDRPLTRYLDEAGFRPLLTVLDGQYTLLRR